MLHGFLREDLKIRADQDGEDGDESERMDCRRI